MTLAFPDTFSVIKVKIYCKSTHTDQYLNFNHPVDHTLGVIHTLYHWVDTVVTDGLDRQVEKSHVNSALTKCGYPKWALDRAVTPKQ